jgi:hypothetical protein
MQSADELANGGRYLIVVDGRRGVEVLQIYRGVQPAHLCGFLGFGVEGRRAHLEVWELPFSETCVLRKLFFLAFGFCADPNVEKGRSCAAAAAKKKKAEDEAPEALGGTARSLGLLSY